MPQTALRSNPEEFLAQAQETLGPTMEQASTLPPACFTDPAFYAREVEDIFKKEWLCVGHVGQIPNVGDYFTTDLFEEPIVITRDRDGQVHALSAVCRHRWMPVIDGAGNTKTLSCPYHRWTYALDGQLMAAPLMEGAEDFDPKACRLPTYALELWHGWIFVSMDPAATSLAARVPTLTAELAPWHIEEMDVVGPIEYDSPFNWKVLVDNFMEGYHHLAIHAETFEPPHPAKLTYVDPVEEPYSVLRIPTRDGSPMETTFPVVEGLTDRQRREFSVFNLYPNHLFAVFPDYAAWYQFELKSVDRFNLKIFLLAPKGTKDDPARADTLTGMQDMARVIHEEDIIACEGAQKGLMSATAAPGRLSLLERAIWEHHGWILERLGAQVPA